MLITKKLINECVREIVTEGVQRTMAKISAKFDRLPYRFFKDDKTKNDALRAALNLAEKGMSYDDAIAQAMKGAFSLLAEEAIDEMLNEGFFNDWKNNRKQKKIEKAQISHDDELSHEIDIAAIESGEEDPAFTEKRDKERAAKYMLAHLKRAYKIALKFLEEGGSESKMPESRYQQHFAWSIYYAISSIKEQPKLMHAAYKLLDNMPDSGLQHRARLLTKSAFYDYARNDNE